MIIGDIEALLYSKVHAVLKCWKHTRCFIEPNQLLPHPGLDYGRFTHIIASHINAYLLFSTTYWTVRPFLLSEGGSAGVGPLDPRHRGHLQRLGRQPNVVVAAAARVRPRNI